MATNYSKHFESRKKETPVPQSQPLPGEDQVRNSAGGFTFKVNKWDMLDRFLILGAEGGTYYAGERTLTRDNAKNVLELLAVDGVRVVNRTVEISEAGRAPKNDPALFVLALAASADLSADEKARYIAFKDDCCIEGATENQEYEELNNRSLYFQGVRQAALAALPRIARTGTFLFTFAETVQAFRGWGRALRNAIANWYNSKELDDLIYQVTKYKARNGWSHRDLLRLSHPRTSDKYKNLVYSWITDPKNTALGRSKKMSGLRAAIEASETDTTAPRAGELIREFNLPREVLRTDLLNSVQVWEALLEKMPANALIRNLGKMTSIGLLAPLSAHTKIVIEKLSNQEWLQKSRIHPLQVLMAMKTYAQGHGEKGSLRWNPVQRIVDALDAAFYMTFKNVEPTGKNIYLALDISGSMEQSQIAGMTGISCRTASAAMALITMAAEKNTYINGFTDGPYESMWSTHYNKLGSGLTPLNISPRQRLDDVTNYISTLKMGGTNCALPMLYATKEKLDVDAFIIYTDSETWAGKIHPVRALEEYRQKTGNPAKLIVVGMTATEFTIADPNDAGTLDVVGFDTAAPQIMADFIR